MSFKRKIRAVLACVMLQYGVMFGAAIRKEDLEELQRAMSQPQVERVEQQSGE